MHPISRFSAPTAPRLAALAVVFVAFALFVIGCASSRPRVETAATLRSVRASDFHVVGRVDGSGDAYSAESLFERANAAATTHRCAEAIVDYERLEREFPSARAVAVAQYNRGICLNSLGRMEDAVNAFRACATHAPPPAPELVRDAWFRLAVTGENLARPTVVLEATGAILALPRTTIAEQVEALARDGAARLAQDDLDGAEQDGMRAIALVPTTESVAALGDDTYIAQARFVAAEVSRRRAAALAIDVDSPDLEHAIERRVQHVVHAHVLYNDAIRVGNPHWAAASGYSLGEMYRALYDGIVNARVPADWDPPAVAIYRRQTAQRLRPFLQGALRAWEATLTMAQRNAIADNTWVQRTGEEIGALRELVLASEQAGPAGEHGTVRAPHDRH